LKFVICHFGFERSMLTVNYGREVSVNLIPSLLRRRMPSEN